MAIANLDGDRVYYRLEGAAGRPVVALSHSLGLDHTMWDPQIAALTARFRVLRYDLRGHGGSDATPGDYTVERLGRDALALLDRLGLDRVAWCGVSLGGMVGQWLAAHAGDRLSSLVLANTSPRIADPAGMEARRRTVLDGGTRAIVDTAMARFFGDALVAANPPRIASARETLLATDPVGYAGCCAALRDFDGTALLPRIAARTLVVSGDADVSMPWEAHGAVLAAAIPNAAAVRLATAHAANLVLPRTFTRTLLEFLSSEPRDAFEAGLDIRRAVLGGDYVDAPDRGHDGPDPRLPALDHAVRLGRDLDAPRSRSPYAAPARAGDRGGARALGGVPPAPGGRPRRRRRMGGRRRGAAADRRVCRRAGREHRVHDRVRGARAPKGKRPTSGSA